MTHRRTRRRAEDDRRAPGIEPRTRSRHNLPTSPEQHDPPGAQLVQHGPQQRHFGVEREVAIPELTVGHTDTEPVVAHDGVASAERLPQTAERWIGPVELHVADPPGGGHEQWPIAGHGVGDPAAGKAQEPDLRPVGHRTDGSTGDRNAWD